MFFLQCEKDAGDDAGGTCRGGGYDQSHGGVHFQHCHRVSDAAADDITADALSLVTVTGEKLRFSSDQTAHGFFRGMDRSARRFFHDLPGMSHPHENVFAGDFGETAFTSQHDLRYRKSVAAAQAGELFCISEIDLSLTFIHFPIPPFVTVSASRRGHTGFPGSCGRLLREGGRRTRRCCRQWILSPPCRVSYMRY